MRNLQAKQINTRQCENVEALLVKAKCYCEFTKNSITQYGPGGIRGRNTARTVTLPGGNASLRAQVHLSSI